MTDVSGTSWGSFRIGRFWEEVIIFKQLNPLCPFSHLPSLERLHVPCPSSETLTAGPRYTCLWPTPPASLGCRTFLARPAERRSEGPLLLVADSPSRLVPLKPALCAGPQHSALWSSWTCLCGPQTSPQRVASHGSPDDLACSGPRKARGRRHAGMVPTRPGALTQTVASLTTAVRARR